MGRSFAQSPYISNTGMGFDFILVSGGFVFIFVFVLIVIFDFRNLIIPDAVNYFYAACGIVFGPVLGQAPTSSYILGGVLGLMTALTFCWGYQTVRKRPGLGLGDVKFIGGAGLWVGWQGLAPVILVASLSALSYVLVVGVIRGGLRWEHKLPFGPFLCFGAFCVWLAQHWRIVPAGLTP